MGAVAHLNKKGGVDMLSNFIVCLAIFVICQAIGDFVGMKTKGILSSVFVATLLYLIGIWTGVLPAEFLETAGISKTITNFALMMVIVAAGTSISIRMLLKQWKTCLICLATIVCVIAACFTLGALLVGRENAIAATPAVAGGMAGATVIGNAAVEKGFPNAAALAYMVVFAQGLIGFPIMSNIARGEMKRRLKDYRNGIVEYKIDEASAGSSKKLIPQIPKKYNTPPVILARVLIVAAIGVLLSQLTNGKVHQLVWCLVLSVVLTSIGFLDEDSLTKAKASGLVSIFMVGNIVYGLVGTPFSEFVKLLLPLLLILVVGVIGIAVGSIVMGLILKVSWRNAILMGICCLCGYPFTVMVIEEGARVNAQNDDEYNYLTKTLVPDVTVAGIVSVTVCSILIAGIFVGLL